MKAENKYYIVLDLEMCQVPKANRSKQFHYKNEIIQIGAVKLAKDYSEVSRFSTFVKPRYGAVNAFIEQLTGITQSQVEAAPDLESAAREFINWVDDDNAVMISWSLTDLRQFQYELRTKDIVLEAFDKYFEGWIDCQDLFGKAVNARDNWSLERALYAADIDVEGSMHDGLMDAVNTASLYRMINTRPDFKLIDVYESTRREEVDHLSFSMGNLLESIIGNLA